MFYEHRSVWVDLVASSVKKKKTLRSGYFYLGHCADPIRIDSVIMFVCVCVLVQISKFRVFCFMSFKVPLFFA